jgi:hypothetical protein
MAVINTGPNVGRLTATSRPPIFIGPPQPIRDPMPWRMPPPPRRLSGLGLTCPPGQTPTNWYDGSVKCCGGPTPESDPCSYLNVNQGYIQTQDQAQSDAISGDAGNASAMLAQLAGYPQNVQLDAIRCQSNPGLTFVDDMGITVTCPSPSHSDVTTGGQPMSTYTVQQLAALLAGQATPPAANETPINLVDVSNSGQGGNAVYNSAPVKTTVNPAPATNNALSNSAAQTGASGKPTQDQINNANNVTGNASNGQGGGAAPASDMTIGGVDVTSWIEQNWVLLAAGAAALLILPGLMKGGR